MRLGFTGTQDGMTERQYDALFEELWPVLDGVEEAHHGMCIGSDDEFHSIMAMWSSALIHGHPPTNQSKMVHVDCAVLHDPKPYLDRNHDIVDAVDRMLAAPRGMTEEQRSGTWSTIRYTRRRGLPLTICWPDGTVTRERLAA